MSSPSYLINTSVEDMSSSLQCAEANGKPYSIKLLKQALAIVTKRGEKTKARIIEAILKKYEREGRK